MAKFVLTAQLQLQAPKNVGRVVNQIQQQLKGVTVDVNAKGTATARREIEKVRSETDKAAKSATNMGKAFAVSIRRFTALAIATRAVSLFSNSLGGAVKEAISFERELVKISQVTGKTMSDLKGLTSTITDLSTTFGVASSSLLNISRVLSQAGFNAKQTETALSTLAKTELAPTFDNISQTAEGAVAIFNQFRKGAEALEAQLGSINAVAGKFAVEAGDLISVVRRAGGVFKSSGGDLNELIALFTSVRSTTRESADSIATGLRTIFTRIQRPKTVEYLKQFGVELIDLEGKFVGPYEASIQLGKALAGLEQGDTTFIKIAEELGGFRQIGKVIPLLQQTRVAQEALSVAQAGANSLTSDAAKAQQTLAVRIQQTQEKFIALIRSMTDTYSFQLMANAALAIADSIVRIGEAIKPVLPLITALAAVKLVKGFGGFSGALSGGGVRGFASGGMVPGTGNQDSVPAMLTPGEFVIRKQSVSKLGASNLSAINGYASGGQVSVDNGTTAGFFLRPEQGIDRDINLANEPNNKINVSNVNALQKMGYKIGGSNKDLNTLNSIGSRAGMARAIQGPKVSQNQVNKFAGLGTITGSTLLPVGGGKTQKASELLKSKSVRDRINKEAQKGGSLKGGKSYGANLSGTLKAFFPGTEDTNPKITKAVNQKTISSLRGAVKEGAGAVIKQLDGKQIRFNKKRVDNAAKSLSTDNNAVSTTSGFVFEGIIQALTGAKLQGKQSNWDFLGKLSNFGSGLGGLFSSSASSFSKLLRADAKRTNSGKARESIISKIESDINGGETRGYSFFKKKAAGGGISGAGTDTVPALLTPGEFVVNKKSAQSIGYGTLGTMNKVGKYADGGIVQRFEDGGGVRRNTGAKAKYNPTGFKTNFTRFSREQVEARRSNMPGFKASQKAAKNMTKLALVTAATSTAISNMLPAVKETDGALLRMTRAISQSTTSTIGSIGALGFAMQGLGDKFSIGNLIKGKFTGPLIAAGGAAMFVTQSMEALFDSTNKFNKAMADGNSSAAMGLATKSSSSGARSGISMGLGAAAGAGIALAPFTAGLSLAATAALSFSAAALTVAGTGGVLYAFSDGLQDFLSQFGYSTAGQIKAQTSVKLSLQSLSKSVQEASDRAAGAFKEAQQTGDFAGAAERVFGSASEKLAATIEEINKSLEQDVLKALPNLTIDFFGAEKGNQIPGRQKLRGFFNDSKNLEGGQEKTLERLGKFISDNKLKNWDTYLFAAQINVQDFAETVKLSSDRLQEQNKFIKASSQFINRANKTAAIGGRGIFNQQVSSPFGDVNSGETITKLNQEIQDLRKTLAAQRRDDRLVSNDKFMDFMGFGDFSRIGETQLKLDFATRRLTDTQIEAYKQQVIGSHDLSEATKSAILSLPREAIADLATGSKNVANEVRKLQERFKALNMGLQTFTAGSEATSLALRNFYDRLNGSASPVEIADRNIKAGLSSRPSSVSDKEFNNSVNVISDIVKQNSGDVDAAKVTERLKAARSVTTSLQGTINKLDASTPEDLSSLGDVQQFRNKIAEDLKGIIPEDDKFGRQLIQVFKDADVEKIAGEFTKGNVSSFTSILSTLSDSYTDQLKPGLDAEIAVRKVLTQQLKTTFDLEQKHIQAQRNTIKTELEILKANVKYGGSVLTARKSLNLLSKDIKATSGRGGVDTSGELKGLISDTASSFKQIEDRRLELAKKGEQLTHEERLEQQGLINVSKALTSQSKSMLDIRRQEYDIIQSKNNLEKSAIRKLMSGDVRGFADAAMTQSAISDAAAGGGNANRFSRGVLTKAFDEIQRMRNEGVSDIGGVGIDKVLRQAATSALSSGIKANVTPVLNRMVDTLVGDDPKSQRAAQGVASASDNAIASFGLVEQNLKEILNTQKLAAGEVANIMRKALDEVLRKTSIDPNGALTKALTAHTNATESLVANGIKIKSSNDVNIRLAGGDLAGLLQGMKRDTAILVRDSIVEAFKKAKIDDNGKITLDENFDSDVGGSVGKGGGGGGGGGF